MRSSRSARNSARSSISAPRATLISHEPGFIAAERPRRTCPPSRASAARARTMKSDSASSSGSDPARRADPGGARTERCRRHRRRGRSRAAPAGVGDGASRSRGSRTSRQAPRRAGQCDPRPTMPMVSVAQLAALERLPRPLALQLEELGQPPADREDHHQHVLRDRVAEHAASVGDEHDAALERRRRERALDARPSPSGPSVRCGARASSRSNASATAGRGAAPRRRRPARRRDPRRDRVTMREPGAAAGIRSQVLRRG